MALAIMVRPRLWLGGVVSPQRAGALIVALVACIRAICLVPSPAVGGRWSGKLCQRLSDGVSLARADGSTRASRAGERARHRHCPGGEAAGGRRSRPSAAYCPGLSRYHGQPAGRQPRRWGHQYRLHRTAQRPFPSASGLLDAAQSRVGTFAPNPAGSHVFGRLRLQFLYLPSLPLLIGSHAQRHWVSRTPALAADLTDHRWSVLALLTYKVPLPPFVPPKRRGRPLKSILHQAVT